MKKILLIVLTGILVIGVVPAFAQLEGNWKGTGDGVCSPPDGSADIPIYAWQSWEGVIYTSPDQEMPIFEGKWHDKQGNYGKFKGTILWISEEEAYCEGSWTWFIVSPDEIKEYDMGKFETYFVHFPVETPYCFGKWQTDYSPDVGSMKGRMVF